MTGYNVPEHELLDLNTDVFSTSTLLHLEYRTLTQELLACRQTDTAVGSGYADRRACSRRLPSVSEFVYHKASQGSS